jgi:hypothetical protein
MKKTLVIAGLAVLSTSAFASKARMAALGQGSTSYYLNDSRSVFLNPAALNDTKNYIVTEWGTQAQSDSSTSPRAEGGFFREMGAFSYGLYLGNNGDARTASTAFLDHQNAMDLMLAGDMGMKWGARLHYANSKDESTTAIARKNSALGLGLGVTHGDMEAYTNITLSDKSEGAAVAGDVWKRKPGFQVGGSYKWSGMTFFADFSSTNEEVTKAAGGITTATVTSSITGAATAHTIGSGNVLTHKTSDITVGAARILEVNPGSRVITDAKVVISSDEISGDNTAANNGKEKGTRLPVTIGMEVDATSWLTVRGNVHQNVLLGSTKTIDGKTKSIANSTTVDAGATLNFGKLKVDGMIGTTSSAGVDDSTAGNGKKGTLSTSNLLTRVGVSYWF